LHFSRQECADFVMFSPKKHLLRNQRHLNLLRRLPRLLPRLVQTRARGKVRI
jgi:hypothetical protein